MFWAEKYNHVTAHPSMLVLISSSPFVLHFEPSLRCFFFFEPSLRSVSTRTTCPQDFYTFCHHDPTCNSKVPFWRVTTLSPDKPHLYNSQKLKGWSAWRLAGWMRIAITKTNEMLSIIRLFNFAQMLHSWQTPLMELVVQVTTAVTHFWKIYNYV